MQESSKRYVVEMAFRKGMENLKIREELKTIKFYFQRGSANSPVITIVIAEANNGMFHRGISICSPADFPNKRVGRINAFKRLREVLTKKNDIVHRLSKGSAGVLFNTISEELHDDIHVRGGYEYILGSWDTKPTNYEREILGVE